MCPVMIEPDVRPQPVEEFSTFEVNFNELFDCLVNTAYGLANNDHQRFVRLIAQLRRTDISDKEMENACALLGQQIATESIVSYNNISELLQQLISAEPGSEMIKETLMNLRRLLTNPSSRDADLFIGLGQPNVTPGLIQRMALRRLEGYLEENIQFDEQADFDEQQIASLRRSVDLFLSVRPIDPEAVVQARYTALVAELDARADKNARLEREVSTLTQQRDSGEIAEDSDDENDEQYNMSDKFVQIIAMMERSGGINEMLTKMLKQFQQIKGDQYSARNENIRIKEFIKGYLQVRAEANINFSHLDLSGLDLSKLDLTRVILEGANLSDCNLNRTTLSQIAGAKFSRAKLQNATLVSAAAEEADFEGANLEGANCRGMTATHANFCLADIDDQTDMEDVVLSGARFTQDSLEPLLGAARNSFNTAQDERHVIRLDGIVITGDLRGLDLSGLSLMDAIFESANLTDVDVTNTYLDGIQFKNCIIHHLAFDDRTRFSSLRFQSSEVHNDAVLFKFAELAHNQPEGRGLSGLSAPLSLVKKAAEAPPVPALRGLAVIPPEGEVSDSFSFGDYSGVNFTRIKLSKTAKFEFCMMAGANFALVTGYSADLFHVCDGMETVMPGRLEAAVAVTIQNFFVRPSEARQAAAQAQAGAAAREVVGGLVRVAEEVDDDDQLPLSQSSGRSGASVGSRGENRRRREEQEDSPSNSRSSSPRRKRPRVV